VLHLQAGFRVSERRACRVVGQNRSTQRPALPLSNEEERLRAWWRAFCRRHSR
jgi:putative transposase